MTLRTQVMPSTCNWQPMQPSEKPKAKANALKVRARVKVRYLTLEQRRDKLKALKAKSVPSLWRRRTLGR